MADAIYLRDLPNGETVDGTASNYTRIIERSDRPSNHRCNDLCMYATGKQCQCACGGRNHGKGTFMCVSTGRTPPPRRTRHTSSAAGRKEDEALAAMPLFSWTDDNTQTQAGVA
ncbi:MAG TPA: hypothetical protein VHY82_15995 [Acetobacteraceae bacterium]|jgi:hypothetical protein|nr:hypothetical protein [Acetobacteraceae bacterium]